MTPPQADSWRYEALEQVREQAREQHQRQSGRIIALEQDIRLVRAEFITRRELDNELEIITERYALRIRLIDGMAAAVGIGALAAVLRLVLK